MKDPGGVDRSTTRALAKKANCKMHITKITEIHKGAPSLLSTAAQDNARGCK